MKCRIVTCILCSALIVLPTIHADAQEISPSSTPHIQDAGSYLLTGKALLSLGMEEQALANFSHALELDPDNVEAYVNRAYIYVNMGSYELGLDDVDRALELDPDNISAHFFRGAANHGLGRYEQAVSDYTRSITLDPDCTQHCPNVYLGRGYAYAHLDKHDQAIADYNRAIEIDPSLTPAYSSRGLAYAKMGNLENALADANRAIELDPANPQAHVVRGMVFEARGDARQALTEYQECVRLMGTATPPELSAYVSELQRRITVNPKSEQEDRMALAGRVGMLFSVIIGYLWRLSKRLREEDERTIYP